MDLLDNESEAEFRTVVQSFVAEHGHKGLREDGDEEPLGRDEQTDWRAALVERGWVAPAWPPEYGGAGLSIRQ